MRWTWARLVGMFRGRRDPGAIVDELAAIEADATWRPPPMHGDPAKHPGVRRGDHMLPGGGFVTPFKPISRHSAMTAAIECLRGCGLSMVDGDRVMTDPQFKFTHEGASPTVKARYSYFRRCVMPWIADLVGTDGASLLLRGLHAEAADGLVVPPELIEAVGVLRETEHAGRVDWAIVHRRGEYRVEALGRGPEGLSASQALIAAGLAREAAKLKEMKEADA